ncbi:MAG: FkbM family methyltransferase [Bacteroidales bacterium]|jgi:FkbM family methyltransferase|nr:FkbM family methyltransferase [Bacteroidales bacterium]
MFNKICQSCYNSLVRNYSNSLINWCRWRVIKAIAKINDPIIDVYEGKTKLRTHASNRGPYHYVKNPLYDKALPRICKQLQTIDNQLHIIDIGANIGDTASLICEQVNGSSILCVEGNKCFLHLLEYNVANFGTKNSIFIASKYCTDSSVNSKFVTSTEKGTAQLTLSENGESQEADTLDNIINKFPEFKKCNLLKIDTDGFEIMVLKGANELLSIQHPIIYFEFSPSLYMRNGQTPMELLHLLIQNNYHKALFYNNYGESLGLFDLSNEEKMAEFIGRVSQKNADCTHYDILCINDLDTEKYMPILQSEEQIAKKE